MVRGPLGLFTLDGDVLRAVVAQKVSGIVSAEAGRVARSVVNNALKNFLRRR